MIVVVVLVFAVPLGGLLWFLGRRRYRVNVTLPAVQRSVDTRQMVSGAAGRRRLKQGRM